jgi:hypothetical protein
VTFTIEAPPGATITDFTVNYTPAPLTAMTMPTIVHDGGPTLGATVESFDGTAGTVSIQFSAVGGTVSGMPIVFDFTTTSPGPIGWGGSFTVSGVTGGPITGEKEEVLVSSFSIPEPASVALLGIGITGLVAFRRFFKRTRVA